MIVHLGYLYVFEIPPFLSTEKYQLVTFSTCFTTAKLMFSLVQKMRDKIEMFFQNLSSRFKSRKKCSRRCCFGFLIGLMILVILVILITHYMAENDLIPAVFEEQGPLG